MVVVVVVVVAVVVVDVEEVVVVEVAGTQPEGFATPQETVGQANWKIHPHFTLHPASHDWPLQGPWQSWAADRQQKLRENSVWSFHFFRLNK